MSTASEEIVLQRKRAAEFSGGTSADVIYSKIEEVTAARGAVAKKPD
jgi:hypothetical protein